MGTALMRLCPPYGSGNDTIYPTGKSMRSAPGRLSSPLHKNILIFRNRKSVYIHGHPVPIRGAFRDRHGRWCGMQWTLIAPLTNGAIADGEVVWS
jgi:hypothetical protein